MLANRLREIREQQELSQRELAMRCGIGEQQIWRYEKGVSEPTTGQFLKIVRELGVSADYLLGLDDEPHGRYDGGALTAFEQKLLASVRKNDTVALLTAILDIAGNLRQQQLDAQNKAEKLRDYVASAAEQIKAMPPHPPIENDPEQIKQLAIYLQETIDAQRDHELTSFTSEP